MLTDKQIDDLLLVVVLDVLLVEAGDGLHAVLHHAHYVSFASSNYAIL